MTRLVITLPLLLAAATLSAQAPGERRVMEGEEGTTLSIDSASVIHSGPTRYTVSTITRFGAPVALPSGGSIDREADLEEIDCGEMKVRGILAQLYLGNQLVDMAALPGAWAPVPEGRVPAIQASCAWLAGSFAAALPIEYSADEVDQQPEPINGDAVLERMIREYPELLRNRQSGSASVSLRFLVTAQGRVERESIQVLSATEPELAAAARRGVLAMRFRPARVNGTPVAVWLSQPYGFSRQVTREIMGRGGP